MALREELHRLVEQLQALSKSHDFRLKVDWLEGRVFQAQRVELIVRIPDTVKVTHREHGDIIARFHVPTPRKP